ncbi:MAG: hypothetical protein F4150_08310, partial [Chloroflexi bacterium]|nr:hypothetical protein [Chloroflexota bacterium]
MFGVLVAAATLAALGVLFAVDPGGAIAESGFPDRLGRDPAQLAAWGFRTAGVVAAQLLVVALWLWPKHRPVEVPEGRGRPWYAGTPPAGSLPAAAVSALVGHAIWSPTKLASLIEMCQRGTLRIEAVPTRVGFLYRLSRQGSAEFAWERTILGSLPARPVAIDELDEALERLDDAIGDQIGDYLERCRLFLGNPVRTRRENLGDGAE